MLKYIFYIVLLILSALFISACERSNQARFFGLSTLINVEVHAPKKQAEKFVHDLQTITDRQQKDLYAWGNGDLAELNKALLASECILEVNDDLLALLLKAQDLHMQSDGLFAPSVYSLVELWGFHDATKMLSKAPSDLHIKALLNEMESLKSIEIQGRKICSKNSNALDLGAIGKGWAAKKTAELLEDYNIQDALIDLGGDLILKGNKNKEPWKIGLRHPDNTKPPAHFNLQTEDEILAVFTSGDYERAFNSDDKHYHHILDPRTGYPAQGVRSVTVAHADPVLADAAATALFIAGHDWVRIAKKMGIQEALIIFSNKKVEITPALQAKTQWLDHDYDISTVMIE